jgi:hypothetical protein
MDSKQTGAPSTAADVSPPRDADIGGDAIGVRESRPLTGSAPGRETEVGHNLLGVKNRVQWGPIIGGGVTAIASMLVLTVLGLAIGASVLEPTDPGENLGMAASIWGGISAILSFLAGGWVAAKSAAVGGAASGVLNGFLVGAAALTLILWLTGAGLGNLFGTVGSNIGEIANIAQDTGVTPAEAEQQAPDPGEAANQAASAFAEAEEGAWGTLIGLLLVLGAAAVGGLLGHNKREDLTEGTG